MSKKPATPINVPDEEIPAEAIQNPFANLKLPPCAYDRNRRHFFMPMPDGNWISVNEGHMAVWLQKNGWSKAETGFGVKIVEEGMHRCITENKVGYAGPLAGCRAGFQQSGLARILVTEGPPLEVLPADTSRPQFPTIAGLVETMFQDASHDQVSVFYQWASRSFTAYRERLGGKADFTFAPAMSLFGPAGCGKSALVELVLQPLFGGIKADPTGYLREGKFNKEMFPAALLVIDDKGGGNYSLEERRQRGEGIKDLIWKPEQRMEGKGADALLSLRPFWRMVICGNDNPAGLQVCPALSESLRDKLIILKTRRADGLPENDEENRVWCGKIAAELPHFAAFLLRFTPPKKSDLDPRTRCINFWHPEIVDPLHEFQPEYKLLDLIQTLELPLPWEGSATEFEQALRELDGGRMTDNIFINSTRAGRLLSELTVSMPNRFQRTNHHGVSHYLIYEQT